MSEILVQMKEIILAQKQIAIISHGNPDGDTLGSQLALANAVAQFGIETILLNQDPISPKFGFLAQSDRLRPMADDEALPPVVVFVDCAAIWRSGYAADDSRLAGRTIINIDHHPSNEYYGQLNYVKADSAACAQVVYELLVEMGVVLDEAVATALYLGLSTDTGSFLFESVSAATHRLAAVLIEAGAHTDAVRANIYENMSRAKFRLQRHVYEHANLACSGQVAWSEISQSLLAETKADSADLDGLVSSLKNIEGVEISLLFRELAPEKTKVSLRSKTWADVNHIANLFGGGGHVRAAGCTLEEPLVEVKAKMLQAISDYLEERPC